jgi:hypothetical protein
MMSTELFTPPDAGTGAAMPACSKLASLAESDTCHAARAMLMCERDAGARASCLLDDATQTQCPTFSSTDCHSACQHNEYVAYCDAVEASIGDFVPPAVCHDAQLTPTGFEYYCCRCDQ